MNNSINKEEKKKQWFVYAIGLIVCHNDKDKVNPKLLNSLVKSLSYLTCTNVQWRTSSLVLALKVATWNWMHLLGHIRIWLIELLLLELFTLYVRLPYLLFKEFKLLGYRDNERAKDMKLWMIERALLGLSFKWEIILSL